MRRRDAPPAREPCHPDRADPGRHPRLDRGEQHDLPTPPELGSQPDDPTAAERDGPEGRRAAEAPLAWVPNRASEKRLGAILRREDSASEWIAERVAANAKALAALDSALAAPRLTVPSNIDELMVVGIASANFTMFSAARAKRLARLGHMEQALEHALLGMRLGKALGKRTRDRSRDACTRTRPADHGRTRRSGGEESHARARHSGSCEAPTR
jgi:hypothetical protein